MDFVDIPLFPKSDDDDSFRTRRDPNQAFDTENPTTMITRGNHGGVVRTRAVLTKVHAGTITKGGPRGTLLVFEFRFQSPNKRRFTNAKLIVEFEDSSGRNDYTLDPVVCKIVPNGSFALNRAESKSDISKKFTGSLGSGLDGIVEASLGFEWEVSREITKEHYTSLTGIPSNEREDEYGEDNSAIWELDEDEELAKKAGIPRYLRTAVLLRHPHNRSFLVKLSVETKVDFGTDIRTFFGMGQTEAVDPVNIDPAKLGQPVEELENMAELKSVDVAFATPLETNN